MATKKTGKAKSGRRRLGRGLTSLISTPVMVEAASQSEDPQRGQEVSRISGATPPPGESSSSMPSDPATRQVVMLPLNGISPRADQPRQDFDEKTLKSLSESIRSAGLMQPILVRPMGTVDGQPERDSEGKYEIIAGERRWRAAEMIGLDRIPAIIQELDDETTAEWSLIENIQREDLNPIERSEAFQRLLDDFGLTHQELAERVGLDRSNVTNHLRLNELDDFCKGAVRDGRMSMGHAKVMLGITNLKHRDRLSAVAIKQGWSVRECEHWAKALRDSVSGTDGPAVSGNLLGTSPGDAKSGKTALSAQLEDLQRRLGDHLGTKVRIVPSRKKGAGRLEIQYFDLDHFEGLMRTLKFECDS